MTTVKFNNNSICGEYEIFIDKQDKYFNVSIPAFRINYFTENEHEIDILGFELVVRFFKLRLDEFGKDFLPIVEELLNYGFKSNSPISSVKKRSKTKKPVSLKAVDFKPDANYSFYKKQKLAA
jgi:hypothetical protein